jgi:hypothetical protein
MKAFRKSLFKCYPLRRHGSLSAVTALLFCSAGIYQYILDGIVFPADDDTHRDNTIYDTAAYQPKQLRSID